MQIFNVNVIAFDRLNFSISTTTTYDLNRFEVLNGSRPLPIYNILLKSDKIEIILSKKINIKELCFINYGSFSVRANYHELFKSEEFNRKYYTGSELGVIYKKNSSSFAVWSPAASSITLLLYKSGDPETKELPIKYPMKENNGLWSTTIEKDLNGFFYTYEVIVYDEINEAADPYVKAAGINGHRGAIIDLNEINPPEFDKDISPALYNFTDAVIYETSIRDISFYKNSGIKNKGKFIGLCEDNTLSDKGVSTGLNHIKELGVTHIQFMPLYDFSYLSVDERNQTEKYNWGYDPQNYNVPEGSFSTDAYTPSVRILELKTMIQHLHKEGLSVNMDVVYNHMFHSKLNNFEKILPGYYFRFNENGTFINGSGCSNDTASEQPMMRRFIVESLMYWAKEYHLDGFRFDLMGLHDIDTMNLIRESLTTLNRPIMVYGEGWHLSTGLSDDLKANQMNAYKMPHIGHFNDTMRDGVRGSVFLHEDRGFANGKEGLENIIRKCAAGCINYNEELKGFCSTPDQSINYVSAHDNNTLWDKLLFTNKDDNFDTLKAIQKLSNAIVLTSQGIPFIHSGAEFCRTKDGIEDSFKSPDNINNLDWDRKLKFIDVFKYHRGLIKLRKEHPAFRMASAEDIKRNLEFIYNTPKNTVAFLIKNNANGDTWKEIIVIFNANKNIAGINIPTGNWNIVTEKDSSGTDVLRTFNSNNIDVAGISTTIMFRNH